jgi:hypothetical protein
MVLKTMRFLNLLLRGVLTGKEFRGFVGFHPALYELPTEAHARAEQAITSRLGKILPPFMIAVVLSFVPVLNTQGLVMEGIAQKVKIESR